MIFLTNFRHVNSLTGVDVLHLTALCPNRDCMIPADSAGGIVDCKVKFWRRCCSLQNRRYFCVLQAKGGKHRRARSASHARWEGCEKIYKKKFTPLPSRVIRVPRSPRACLCLIEERKKVAPVLQASEAVNTSSLRSSTPFFVGAGDGRRGKTASFSVPLSRKLCFFANNT